MMSITFARLPMEMVNHILSYTTSGLRKKMLKIYNTILEVDYYNGLYILPNTYANSLPNVHFNPLPNNVLIIPNYYGIVVIDCIAYIITREYNVLAFRNFITNKLLYRYHIDFEHATNIQCYKNKFFMQRNEYAYVYTATRQTLTSVRFLIMSDFILAVDNNGYLITNDCIDFMHDWFGQCLVFTRYNDKVVARRYNKNNTYTYYSVDILNRTCRIITSEEYLLFFNFLSAQVIDLNAQFMGKRRNSLAERS